MKYFDKEIEKLLNICNKRETEILFTRSKGMPLGKTGEMFSLTKERIRQIENRCIKKIQQNFPDEITDCIKNILKRGKILFINDLPIKNEIYKKFLVFYFVKTKTEYFDKKLNGFYIKSYNEILKPLYSQKPPVLTEKELNLPGGLVNFLIKKNIIKKLDGDKYFVIGKFKNNKGKTEFIISLFKNGIAVRKNFDAVKEKFKIYFNDDTRTLNAVLSSIHINSNKIVLWGWGVYIHIDNIKKALNSDYLYIIEYLYKNIKNNTPFDLRKCFNIFENRLLKAGIPNVHALHSVLKIKYPKEFEYSDSPYIVKIR